MTKFFNKSKNAHFVAFLVHSPHFIDSFFLQKIRTFHAQLHMALSNPMSKFRKNQSSSKKKSGGRTGRSYL